MKRRIAIAAVALHAAFTAWAGWSIATLPVDDGLDNLARFIFATCVLAYWLVLFFAARYAAQHPDLPVFRATKRRAF